MPRYNFIGSVRLDGVVFTITAPSEDEAKIKADAGDYDEYDEMGAETADWTIDPKTIEPAE